MDAAEVMTSHFAVRSAVGLDVDDDAGVADPFTQSNATQRNRFDLTADVA